MKRLKKILLMNWLYFSKQVIELEDLNFLTGKTGAGKSTVIDALQIVLLGETNARNFNKAANENSQRTLDGYLRADMDGNNPNSRRGRDFSSYIACEYYDDIKNSRFVAGIVFDCHADGSRQDAFFLYDGAIPEHCFTVNQLPMNISRLRVYVRDSAGITGKLYATHKEYREDLLAKWNVHREQIFRMLKKAVSFQPIVDIQKFITENVCDIPERPDIASMQENIRDYQRHEELARRQEEKLEKLSRIASLYREKEAARKRFRMSQFLTLWAEKENTAAEIARNQERAAGYEERVRTIRSECEQMEQERRRKESRRKELERDKNLSDVFQEQERLERKREDLREEQRKIAQRLTDSATELKRESQILRGFGVQMRGWPEREELRGLADAAVALQRSWTPFADSQSDIFSASEMTFENARAATERFASAAQNAAYAVKARLTARKEQMEQDQSALENLRRNQKDYPHGLLSFRQRLCEELERETGRRISVEILADTLEIADGQERWRNAIEGYLHTQKFYLLVPEKYYGAAARIVQRIRSHYAQDSFGLADIGKLRQQERLEARENSLASKIETNNGLARSYIDYLLGRVVACERIEQLRERGTAITPDGMLYQGYVLRPIPTRRMEDAFIGQKAIALRVQRLEREIRDIGAELRLWEPVSQRLENWKSREYPLNNRYLQQELPARRRDYERSLAITEELSKNEEAMSQLDLTWLSEMARQIEALTRDIEELSARKADADMERGNLSGKIDNINGVILPDLRNRLMQQETEITNQFSEAFRENEGVSRYRQELARLKSAERIAKNSRKDWEKSAQETQGAENSLFRAREEYARSYPPCPFRVDAPDNDEFAEEQRKLEESELPRYREKIRQARQSALEQFQNDFLAKISESIQQVQRQVDDLNRVLRHGQFGTDSYRFIVSKNPDYADYYDMIQDFNGCDGGLFALPLQQKYGSLIEDLFSRIATADDASLNARKRSELEQNIETYTDFRTYLRFDLETTDQNGNRQMLSKTLNTKSGGETQTPFYIAVLASFAQLYQVSALSSVANNTMRLVVFDEAFNKMDSERIVESVRLLRKMKLQAIICTPPDKISDIAPLADCTLLVGKRNYQMSILPWRKEEDGTWNETP